MVGSPIVATFVAQGVFWTLVCYGAFWKDLGAKRIVLVLLMWLIGRFGLSYVIDDPFGTLFSSFVALLDIALVFMIFRGDVRLT
jgi:hypothetical protein